MNELRIILDKSVVYGLNNDEIDSLDRYFFQIIPPILMNEILADLTKLEDQPDAERKLRGSSYRIGGNRGLTPDYRILLKSSLLGHEGPMDGEYLPSGERPVQTTDGKLGVIIETPDEDETIMRWEQGEFTEEEKTRAELFRQQSKRPLDYPFYVERLTEVGIVVKPTDNTDVLFELVESVLRERKFQGRLFALLQQEHGFTSDFMWEVFQRWALAGAPMFETFAPYAFYCLRASLIWILSTSSPGKNDRKDLEYLYHLPFTELFSSKDSKHERLVPYLLKENQAFVPAKPLKEDLAKLTIQWNALSRDEQIKMLAKRSTAPPEDETSLVYQLWKRLRGTVSPNMLPADPNSELLKIIRRKAKELLDGKTLPVEVTAGRKVSRGMRRSRKTRERVLKMYPQLSDSDLDNKN